MPLTTLTEEKVESTSANFMMLLRTFSSPDQMPAGVEGISTSESLNASFESVDQSEKGTQLSKIPQFKQEISKRA
jgi:hypothetical protein